MKKILLGFFTIIISCCLSAQYVQLGNTPLRTLLLNRYPGCFNVSLELDTTCTSITTATSLDLPNQALTNLNGLQFFDNLRSLNLKNTTGNGNGLYPFLPSSVDTLNLEHSSFASYSFFPSNIKWLNISNNNFDFFDLADLPPSLQYFNAANCMITQGNNIDFPAGLKYLNISHCRFAYLNSLPANLDTLICDAQLRFDNLSAPTLTALPSLASTLKYLDFSSNGLTSVPTLPSGLKYLNCGSQTVPVNSALTYEEIPAITSLPTLPAGLEYLICPNSSLGVLPALPPTLIYLDCSGNKFERPVFDGTDWITYESQGIPDFTSLPSGLLFLSAGGNRMSTLPALPSGLIHLSVGNMGSFNSLPSLPATLRFLDVYNTSVNCLPTLPPSLLLPSPYPGIAADLVVSNGIKCLPNRLQGLRIKTYSAGNYINVSLPVCNFFNNPHNCPVVPTMSGLCFYDNNSNGTQDAGELPMGGVQFSLANGEVAFSGDNGLYNIGGELGGNNLSITPRPFYTAVPAAINYNFSRYDTVVNATIALKPNAVIDSLKITITPLNAARPGFDFAYGVKFENVGTTTQANCIVKAIFDNNQMSYENSSPGVSVSGNILTLNAGSLSPGQRGEFTSNFSLLNNVPLGSQIVATASITSGTHVYSDINSIVVQGSFDPNEKYATTVLTRQEVQNGGYIDYIVCFQNSGTDTAFNVQILDELDPQLDAASFIPVASSHTCISKRSGKYLSFEFPNILLVDSATNEPASHGYVRFRVKPLAGLPDNTIIPNSAGIYFDFNSPVLTAAVSSLINVTAVPLTLQDFTARPEGSKVRLHWNTTQEINSRNFIVEHAGDGHKWKAILDIPAAGNSGRPSFYEGWDLSPLPGINYYRLRMNDRDGACIYSPVRQVLFGKENSFTVSPNPARHFALVTVDASLVGAAMNVFDQAGKKIFTGKITGTETTLAITGWQPGIYYVNVFLKDIKLTEKLAVQ